MATIIPEPAPQEPRDPDEAPRAAPRERLKREDPKRSGPVRSASHYLRDSHSWDDGAPDPAAVGEPHGSVAETLDDVITRGVHLGYKVIEEHLLKGQRAAQQLRQPRPEADSEAARDFDAFAEQAQRLYQDVGTLCFDALELLARSPTLLRGLIRARQTTGSGPAPDAELGTRSPAAPGVAIAIEIASRHRTRVDLRLHPNARLQHLHAHALHPSGSTVPPVTGIAFRPDRGSGQLVLEVSIPDHQPAGVYSGIVVDGESNEPVGSLTLRVIAPAAP